MEMSGQIHAPATYHMQTVNKKSFMPNITYTVEICLQSFNVGEQTWIVTSLSNSRTESLSLYLHLNYNSMKHSPPWKANSCSASQISQLLCNTKVHYCVHKSLPLDLIISLEESIPHLTSFTSELYIINKVHSILKLSVYHICI